MGKMESEKEKKNPNGNENRIENGHKITYTF